MAQVVLGLVLVGGSAGCGQDPEKASGDPSPTVTVTETVTSTPTPTAAPSESVTADPTPTESTEPSPVETSAPPSGEMPRTYDAATALFDAYGQEPVAYRRFATPDGEIYCVLDDKALPPGCELGQTGGAPDPEVCGEALSKKVGRIEVQDGRPTPVCNTDTIRGDMPDVLGPGEAARAGDLQCLNADAAGVVCVLLSATEGFALRAGEYAIFDAG